VVPSGRRERSAGVSTDREAIARRWSTDGGMGNPRSADDYTDSGCRLLAEHAFRDVAALLAFHPEPRVWRAGDDEPGEDVRAVLDCNGDLWQPDGDGYWRSRFDGPLLWRWLAFETPLVEGTLPQAVTE